MVGRFLPNEKNRFVESDMTWNLFVVSDVTFWHGFFSAERMSEKAWLHTYSDILFLPYQCKLIFTAIL